MRTLVRLPATSILLIGLALTPAFAGTPPVDELQWGPQAAPQIRIVRISTQPRSSGGQVVRYTVLQRVQPLLAVAVPEDGPPSSGVWVGSEDFVTVSYDAPPAGWETIGTLTIEEHLPGAPVNVAAAPASPAAASSEAEASERLELAIAPVRPVHGGALVVDISLPGVGPARLEMLDVMGRRIASRDLGSLGAGRHAIDLGTERRFAPGVYLLRLTQAGESKVARVTVLD